MPLVTVARYMKTIERAVECYHVARAGSRGISTIAILQHDLDPREFAVVLGRASKWFQEIAQGKIAPCAKQDELR